MKTKYSIFFLVAGFLAACLSLNSCDNRLDIEKSDDFRFSATAVSYNGIVGTKAAPINTVSAFESTYPSFMVSAYKNTAGGFTNRFKNGTSSYDAGEWNLTASNVKWYPNETLDFFAIAPANLGGGLETPGIMPQTVYFGHYASPGDDGMISGSELPDIMFGYYSGEGVLNTAGSKRIAPLTFYHLLSAIRFVAGDIAGATVNTIKIKNAGHTGFCGINYANLATAGNDAISWSLTKGVLGDYGDTYSVTAVENEQIGTDAQTLMIFPQTLGPQAKLEVSLTVTDAGVDTDFTLEASLEGVVLESGKILTFKINYADIPISFIEPEGMIVPWAPTAAVHINDPQLVPKYAYLPTGTVFNNYLNGLAGGRENITKITFNRFGDVDEGALEIQADTPIGEPIYALYDNGEVTITTHANTIYLNADCSEMFKDMTGLAAIQWGNFFESEALANTMGMFRNCSSLLDINLTDVLDTRNVTNMSYMFDGCTAVNRIVLGLEFYTSNVTDMNHMFCNCSSMHILDKGSHFSTPNVTDMSYMYYNCSSIGILNLSSLASATNLDYMFYNCQLTDRLHFNNLALPVPYPSVDHMLYNAVVSPGSYVMIRRSVYDWLIEHISESCIDPSISHSFTEG